MNSDQLRTLQAPLKAHYKKEPNSAAITLHAEGELGEGISCSVDTGRAIAVAGLHEATGGTGLELCSGDMLLQALVACAGVTMKSVATAIGVAVAGLVRAEGELDWRGTLGVDREVPVGFSKINLTFELETDASEEQLATLHRLTDRYCVVLQTLATSPALKTSVKRT